MNYSEKNRKNLVKKYIEMAEQRLKGAKVLLAIDDYRDSVSRSYYGMLDAVTALLITKDLIPKSHQGAIRLFSQYFIKPGIVPRDWAKIFRKIEKYRHEADYSHKWKFTKEETEEIYKQAEEFINLVKSLLKKY